MMAVIGHKKTKRRLGRQEMQLKETLIFLLKLLALAVPMHLILLLSIGMTPLQEAASSELSWALHGLGYTVERDGFMFSVSGGRTEPFVFYIVEDCTAWKTMLFLAALIVAVPAVAWKRRVVGIALGLPALWLLNLARNVSVVLIERSWGYETAMAMHDWLWKLGMILAVLLLWLVWWRWVRHSERAAKRARPHFKQRKEQ